MAPSAADHDAARWQTQRVRSLLSAMRRRWKLVALAVILALLGVSASLYYIAPYYTSTVLVQLGAHEEYANFDNVVGGLREGDSIAIRTERQVIRSEAIVGRVVGSLRLVEDPKFNPVRRPPGPMHLIHEYALALARAIHLAPAENENSITVKQVLRRLDLDSDERSYIVGISFTARDAAKAAQIANAFAREYLKSQIDSKSAITAKATECVKLQLDDAREQMLATDAAVERFRARNVAISEVGPGNVDELPARCGFLGSRGSGDTAHIGFDVALDGPVLGIWFWTIYGIGIAAMIIHRHEQLASIGARADGPREPGR